jgi:hypothetical protein
MSEFTKQVSSLVLLALGVWATIWIIGENRRLEKANMEELDQRLELLKPGKLFVKCQSRPNSGSYGRTYDVEPEMDCLVYSKDEEGRLHTRLINTRRDGYIEFP